MEWERVPQTEFEFDHLSCNRVGGECGSSPTLVFLHVFIWHKEKRKQVQQNISNNKIFIYKSIGTLHDWNLNMIGMKYLKYKENAPNLFFVAGVA